MSSTTQVQVADIGLVGGPAKINGKSRESVCIFSWGPIGKMLHSPQSLETAYPHLRTV